MKIKRLLKELINDYWFYFLFYGLIIFTLITLLIITPEPDPSIEILEKLDNITKLLEG